MVLHSSQLLLQATVPALSSYPNRRAYFVSFLYLLTDSTYSQCCGSGIRNKHSGDATLPTGM
jgi:hypothetical protein